MSDHTNSFGVISDDNIYGARKWLEDLQIIASTKSGRAQMKRLDGRHLFWMHPTEIVQQNFNPERELERRVYAVLRIDEENQMVSGDVFRDIRRRDWIGSWVSEAIFFTDRFNKSPREARGWHLLVIADFHRKPYTVDEYHPHAKVAIAIRGNENHIEACRIIGFDGADAVIPDLSRTGTDKIGPPFKTFRHLKLVNLFHSTTEADARYVKIARTALGKEGENLRKTLKKTGSRIYAGNIEGDDSSVEDRTVETSEKVSAFEMLAPYQWTDTPFAFVALLTTLEPDNEKRLGVVPGLDNKQLLHKSRFGCIVYIKKIIDVYLRSKELTIDDYEEHVHALTHRIRRFYIHEMGHLLNLPHPWQRDAYAVPAMPANPAARSWMNYSSYYPLGRFMQTSRNWAAKGDSKKSNDLQLIDAFKNSAPPLDSDERKEPAGPMFEPGFTGAETRWLRHAPFSQIIPGGSFFTESFVGEPKLANPTERSTEYGGKYLWLKLDLWDSSIDDEGYHRLARPKSGNVERQPVFGKVSFRVPKYILEGLVLYFTFQSPMLSLLVRSEYPKNPISSRETRVIKAVQLPYDSQYNSEKNSSLRGEEVEEQALYFVNQGNFETFSRFIPMIQSSFFKNFGNGCYSMQVVLRAYSRIYRKQVEFYSNVVKIKFLRSDQAYAPDQQNILLDRHLPLLVELLPYSSPEHKIEHIKIPTRHTLGYEPQFETLVENVKQLDLEKLPFSKQLFTYLKEKLRGP